MRTLEVRELDDDDVRVLRPAPRRAGERNGLRRRGVEALLVEVLHLPAGHPLAHGLGDRRQQRIDLALKVPARKIAGVLAKLGCNFVLGMGSMALSVLLATELFGVPFRGGLLALAATNAGAK